MLADAVSQQPELGKIDQNRKETMLRILEMAEQQKELENDERISRIKKSCFLGRYCESHNRSTGKTGRKHNFVPAKRIQR